MSSIFVSALIATAFVLLLLVVTAIVLCKEARPNDDDMQTDENESSVNKKRMLGYYPWWSPLGGLSLHMIFLPCVYAGLVGILGIASPELLAKWVSFFEPVIEFTSGFIPSVDAAQHDLATMPAKAAMVAHVIAMTFWISMYWGGPLIWNTLVFSDFYGNPGFNVAHPAEQVFVIAAFSVLSIVAFEAIIWGFEINPGLSGRHNYSPHRRLFDLFLAGGMWSFFTFLLFADIKIVRFLSKRIMECING